MIEKLEKLPIITCVEQKIYLNHTWQKQYTWTEISGLNWIDDKKINSVWQVESYHK